MSDLAIRCKGIAKQYSIGERERYRALRDTLTDTVTAPFRRVRAALRGGNGTPPNVAPTIWALKDVSFEVKSGEVVGIIGRNGAGKSTLLKILSRITKPTLGSAGIYGRVGSLLEVGTGFHPELTGRENVYLNGAILGMSKAEIDRKFDEIVAFSELEKFIDTPVKRYSSGMYMRLAFAVAAHLDTEILAIDEVLAVGDASFQKKCLGKMGEATVAGRTVLFVSHNMNAIEQLCRRAILLDAGSVLVDSPDVRSVIAKYFLEGDQKNPSVWVNDGTGFQNPYFRPIRMAIVDGNGNQVTMPVRNDANVWIEIEGEIERADSALTVGYGLFDEDGRLLYWTCQTDPPEAAWPQLSSGTVRLKSKFPNHMLNEGKYRLDFLASLHYRAWLLEPGGRTPHIFFTIQGGLSDSPFWMAKRPGLLAPVIRWQRIKSVGNG